MAATETAGAEAEAALSESEWAERQLAATLDGATYSSPKSATRLLAWNSLSRSSGNARP